MRTPFLWILEKAHKHKSLWPVTPPVQHRVNGVGRGGGQAGFNQILTRFHEIRLKYGESPAKILLKAGRNPLKSCVLEGTERTLAGSKG